MVIQPVLLNSCQETSYTNRQAGRQLSRAWTCRKLRLFTTAEENRIFKMCLIPRNIWPVYGSVKERKWAGLKLGHRVNPAPPPRLTPLSQWNEGAPKIRTKATSLLPVHFLLGRISKSLREFHTIPGRTIWAFSLDEAVYSADTRYWPFRGTQILRPLRKPKFTLKGQFGQRNPEPVQMPSAASRRESRWGCGGFGGAYIANVMILLLLPLL